MDGGTQIRISLDPETIDDYHQDMLNGDEFPPVKLYFDGENYWLGDGFYRTHARMKNPAWTTISAEIIPGTLRDAILCAIGANATHGRPRTNEEKRLAVRRLLEDEDWRKLADNVLCKMAHVSQPFVGSERKKLSQNILSGQPDVRIGSDGKERNTANIGRRKKDDSLLIDMSEVEDTDITPLETDDYADTPTSDDLTDELPPSSGDQGQSGLFDKRNSPPQPPRRESSTSSTSTQRAAPLTQKEPDTDPEGWADLKLKINVTINPGKSPRRGIMVSGQAGDNTPIFLTQYTLADLEPLPAPFTDLVGALKRAYAKKLAKEASKTSKSTRRKPSKKR